MANAKGMVPPPRAPQAAAPTARERAADVVGAAAPEIAETARDLTRLAWDNINWRAALVGAGRLLVAIAIRDYAGALEAFLRLVEAFGLRLERADAAGTEPTAQSNTVDSPGGGV